MNTRRQYGFTLWELLMTLLVGGIILGFGVPNIMEFQRNSAMTAAANDFITATLMARTEAVKRQAPVTLCLSDNPTVANPTCSAGAVFGSATRGYVVFVDENNNFDADGSRVLTDGTDNNHTIDAGELVLGQTEAPGVNTRVRVSANCGYITFAPTGFPFPLAAPCNPAQTQRNVLFCDDRGLRVAAGGLLTPRIVRTDRTGRPQVLTEINHFSTLIMNGFNSGGAGCPVSAAVTLP